MFTIPSSTATTPRSSVELAKSAFKHPIVSVTSLSSYQNKAQSTRTSKSEKLWTSIKRHVREHHESLNAVYANHYGQGHERRVKIGTEGVRQYNGQDKVKEQEVWVYERGIYGRS